MYRKNLSLVATLSLLGVALLVWLWLGTDASSAAASSDDAALGSSPHKDSEGERAGQRVLGAGIAPEAEGTSAVVPGSGQAIGLSLPLAPPIASLIAIDDANLGGIATVSGMAGAVEPQSPVWVANLATGHMTATMSLADGSFETNLFAPAGSWIQVKHGGKLRDPVLQSGEEDMSWLNPLPGTILRAPLPDQAPAGATPFAMAGAVVPGAGEWMLEGHVITEAAGVSIMLRVSGTLRIATPVITSGTTISDGQVAGMMVLQRFFTPDGRRVPPRGVFASTFRTPTGLPISRGVSMPSPHESPLSVTGWHYAGGRVVEATLSGMLQFPADLPPGIYRPRLQLHFSGVPLGPGQAFTRFGVNNYHYLPAIRVGDPEPPRLTWVLLVNTLSNATRGTVARQDREYYGLIPHIITQADRFIIPRLDARTGQPISYRLEPFLPFVSMGDRSIPGMPSIPFRLPSGSLEVHVRRPDGTVDILGPAPFLQSANTSPHNRQGKVYDEGGGRIDEMYQLTTLEDAFSYAFEEYGHYVITMTGSVEDIWGDVYLGDSTYDVHVARLLKLDPGQLPTTPYEVDDAFSPGLQVYPPVPADVEIRLLLPQPGPEPFEERFVTGQANRFGYFQPPAGFTLSMAVPGEFRVDITAIYDGPDGALWMGSATWGNVIETPGSPLVVHGRRGRDLIPPWDQLWFYHDDLPKGLGLHSMYPYWSGDVLWGSDAHEDDGGNAIIPAITLQDTVGEVQSIIEERWATKDHSALAEGLDFDDRVANGELPLFSTTSDGTDLFWSTELIDQVGYAYRTSERPGVRVHETISEDSLGIAYWRFIAEFGGQAGIEGDMPHDLKWEFGGTVFRLISETHPIDEYGIYGSLWVLLPDTDGDGARVAPPFRGATGAVDGGPIMVLKGQPIDLFFMPKGVQPGDVLEVGDTFSFAGHVGPPLDSRVMVTITSPSGVSRHIEGSASKVGWFYDPSADFPVEERGSWAVQVRVVHDKPVPSGGTPEMNNTGGVLGTADGIYRFYVVERDSPRLAVDAPQPGFLVWPIDDSSGVPITVTTVPVHVPIPPGFAGGQLSYTIRMPGFVLEQGTILPTGDSFVLPFDPLALHGEFPNLDLKAKDADVAGLSDPVLISFLLSGELEGQPAYRAGMVFLDGDEVLMPWIVSRRPVFLPVVLRDH